LPEEINCAQPPLKFIPPKFNPFIRQLTQWTFPIIQRFRLRPWLPAGILRFETKNVETLANLYHQFQIGKVRFLLAFRHSEVDDPLSMFYLLSHAVPKVARELKISLQQPIHSHFIYDRGMTVWAGEWLGWIFSRLGGFPIHRGKRIDKQAMQTARELFLNSKMPIAVAPEGATNGHSGIVSPLEPGVSQLGFWCVEDLLKAHRPEEVFIVPISIRYSYINPPWEKLDWLLSKLESDSGLTAYSSQSSYRSSREEVFYERLLRIAENLLSQMEDFYKRYYHQGFDADVIDTSSLSPNQIILSRLHRLQGKALGVAEQYFGIQPQGNTIDRCRRLEEAGWSYIYRSDLPDLNTLPPLKRGLADWVAVEADLRMRHMRIVESFVAVTEAYVKENPTVERFAEMGMLMYDMMSRIQDDKLPGRPRLGWRQSLVTVGEPISVTRQWELYQKDRHAAREVVTQDLYEALQGMIG
jgi:1-acyl-sn-glycerol-3-phosphate acyltransferase